MSHLQGQSAMISGGSSGIGLSIARALMTEGVSVSICARDANRLKLAAGELEKLGGKVLAVPTDVSVRAEVEAWVRQSEQAFGRVDLLVNNAGIGNLKTIEESTEEDWEETQAINLKGAFLCTKAVFPIMKRQRSGYIVNIASVAGKFGFGGAAAYCASKFGMVGLTESLLEETVPFNIRATAICPGYVATPMVAGVTVPQQEMIPPDDLGKLVVGLLHLSPITVIKEIVVERTGSVGT